MILKRVSNRIKNIFLTFFLSIGSVLALAQTPTHIPRQQPDPVGFFDSIENIIFYVVIPILILILYFLWRKQVQKQKHQEEQERREKEQE